MKKLLCKLFGHLYDKIEFLHGGLLQPDKYCYSIVVVCRRCGVKQIVFNLHIKEDRTIENGDIKISQTDRINTVVKKLQNDLVKVEPQLEGAIKQGLLDFVPDADNLNEFVSRPIIGSRSYIDIVELTKNNNDGQLKNLIKCRLSLGFWGIVDHAITIINFLEDSNYEIIRSKNESE